MPSDTPKTCEEAVEVIEHGLYLGPVFRACGRVAQHSEHDVVLCDRHIYKLEHRMRRVISRLPPDDPLVAELTLRYLA